MYKAQYIRQPFVHRPYEIFDDEDYLDGHRECYHDILQRLCSVTIQTAATHLEQLETNCCSKTKQRIHRE